MNFENEELKKLEEELEGKLKGQVLPKKSEWKPYEKFMKDLKKDKTAKTVPKITIDKKTRQLYADLEKQQKKDQKKLLKEIKKLSEELNQMKIYQKLKETNQNVKKSMKKLKKRERKEELEMVVRDKAKQSRGLREVEAFKNFKKQYIYAVDYDNLNGFDFADKEHDNTYLKNILVDRLSNEYEKIKNDKTGKYSLKAYIEIKSLMIHDDGLEYKNHVYTSQIYNIVSKNNIKDIVINIIDAFNVSLTVSKDSSQWNFVKFLKFTIGTQKFKSILGKSYIKLPQILIIKNACVNIKNKDDKCFEYCLIASRIYDGIKSKDKNEVYHYNKNLDIIKRPANITYPIITDDIPLYEDLNDMQINVFSLSDYNDDTKDIREFISEEYKSDKHRKEVVNLLLVREGDLSHYVLIKNINRLFASKTNKGHTKHICEHCLIKSFNSVELLNKHKIKCQNLEGEDVPKIDLICECPEEGKNIMKFNNEGRAFKHPFHVIADFESTLTNCDAENDGLTGKELEAMTTKKYQKHLQNSFGVKFCCDLKEHSKDLEIINNSEPEEVSKQFILKLESYAQDAYNLLQKNKKNILWKEGEKNKHFQNKNCQNCNTEYTSENKRVAHHNHINGEFISSLCNECNLKFQYKPFLPVYLHNLKGYDSHLFVNALYKYGTKGQAVSCIPNNEERYISFSKNVKVDEYYCKKDKKKKDITFEIRFLDTIAFMNSSIESLVVNLKNGCDSIEKLREAFPNTSNYFKDDNQFELMTKKGIYPYDFINTYDKLNINYLPSQDKFYSKLYNSECSDEDYKQALNVWDKFNCKTFLDYHNLYLKSDVLLLSDVWSNFRNICYKNYKLDCLYYYTAPGLSFDAMLKHTKIELELLTDIEKYEFCEGGIRGGLSQISKRYAKANNKYMSNYDETKEDSYIFYGDANNLYGHSMSQYLPVGDFKWNTEEWTKEKILNISDTADKGYKFKVDLRIPENLHDHFNNYVPCPENIIIKKDKLNKWQQEDYRQTKIKKLCCSFDEKIDYIVDYRYLKLCLSLGVELVKVSKVLEYSQKPFLKDYIELNTDLRKNAQNDFETDFFKLMNNSVFGKTMESVRNRINFRLVDNEDSAWRVKNLNRFTIFDENLIGVHIQKMKIKLNKPVYLGQTILDDSKALMYNFHYNFILKKVKRENIDLLFTDTDSLCYHIRKEDIFQIIKDNKDEFDLSNYPKDDPLYDATNKKVIGKFKNESIKQITEFVGLRAKLYAFTVDNDDEKHLKCKGVKSGVVKKDLNIEKYRNCLFSRKSEKVKQNSIRSYGHQIYTEEINKTALSSNDNKVYICDDNINTYNLAHYRTK